MIAARFRNSPTRSAAKRSTPPKPAPREIDGLRAPDVCATRSSKRFRKFTRCSMLSSGPSSRI
jgi:hypothetical protein